MPPPEKKQEPSGYTWEMCKKRKEQVKNTTLSDKLKALKKEVTETLKKKG